MTAAPPDRPRPPRARHRARRAAAAAGRRRTRWSAPSWSGTGRCWARASTPPTAAPTPSARRCARAATRAPPGRRCTSRWSRAATRARPRRARTRSSRRASPASWSPPTTRPRRPPAAASGSCATRAWRSRSPRASWRRRARLLNQPFRKHARTGIPWVLFKSAMTLDGKVATRTGDSKWISGDDSRRLAHRWRAECDAVACGIGTALADDPQLTARIEGVHRQPRRIVFDSEARLPLDSALIQSAPRAAADRRRLARRLAPRHRRPRGRRRRRDRRHRRERAGARARTRSSSSAPRA